MDTKLKNKHKLAVILIALTIFVPAMAVIQQYPRYYRQTAKGQESIDKSAVCSSNFMEKFIGAGYLLYNTENSEEDGEDTAEEVKESASPYGIGPASAGNPAQSYPLRNYYR